MKGLLSSRLLKGPSGVERLSKALYRRTKLRKRSRRFVLGLSEPDNLFLQVNPSVFEEQQQKEGEDHDQEKISGDGVVGINISSHTLDYHNYIDSDSQDDDNDFNNKDDDDDVTILEIQRNDERERREEDGSGSHECDDDGTDDDDDDDGENEGSIDESKEEEEVENEGNDAAKEDFPYVYSGHIDGVQNVPASENSYDSDNQVIKREDSFLRWENNESMQEKDADANDKHFCKGPIVSSDWEAAMSSVAEIPTAIAFICGGKNTGKSTFARCLVNSLLNRYGKVGFLDTDVGQPEFTPSGCLSLHVLDKPIVGLPALEMKEPERCYFFGDISPKSNPEVYLKDVFSLYDHFENEYTNYLEGEVSVLKKERFPLVINTHGWIQGVGFDVLIKIIDHVLPTHIVQILSKTPSRNLPPNRFWESSSLNHCNSQLLYINNALGESTHLAEIKFDARELRDLRLLSYFQKNIKDKLMPTSRLSSVFESAATALACCKPFQVPISAIKVVHLHFQVPACESVYSLNAALVGLGVSDDRSEEIAPRCVGLGIVRAVDISRGIFYVITPIKLEALQQVDTFLQGRMELPVSLLKAPGYFSPYLCNNTISIEGTGSAVMGKGKKKALRFLRTSAIA